MATSSTPSRLVAFLTLFFFLGICLAIGFWAYQAVSDSSQQTQGLEVAPTPTPEPGTFNIDEQLDLLH